MSWLIRLSPSANSPERRLSLDVSVKGDTIFINGEGLDLSNLKDGDILPASSVASDFVVGMITKTSGQIGITLVLPYNGTAPESVCFPKPIVVTSDGPVTLPTKGLK